MNNIEQGGDFHSLLVACAGQSRQEQKTYLMRLIMKFMIERFKQDQKLPDANVRRQIGFVNIKDTEEAIKILDACYFLMATALLDGSDVDLTDIRLRASAYMRADLERRQTIQKEAGLY